jgi:hypothetical protein
VSLISQGSMVVVTGKKKKGGEQADNEPLKLN